MNEQTLIFDKQYSIGFVLIQSDELNENVTTFKSIFTEQHFKIRQF